MEHTVVTYLQTQKLLNGGERVTAAVSGGADSMALLSVLISLQDTLGITVSAAHFNHGLRGEEAGRDEAFVRQWCAAHQIPFTAGHGDVRAYARQHGQSIEEAARTLRYAFFDSLDTDCIATAHTADDNAETLLLHLLRGTGPRGLCGIPAKRGKIIRPFLTVSRAQIEQYLTEKKIPHIEDSSNAENDCVRNRIRHEVMPLLLRENPQFLSAASRTAALQTQEETFLSALAREAAEDCRTDGGCDCQKLRALDPVLLHRVLLGLLREQSVENPSACFVAALERLVQTADPSAEISLPDGLRAVREYDLLRFTKDVPADFSPVTVPIPGSAELAGLGLTVTCYVMQGAALAGKKEDTVYLNYDTMADTVTLRPRRSGDALVLPGGTKTVKKWMIDRKLPAASRSRIPVIELDGQVAAVGTLAVSRPFMPDGVSPVLVVKLQRRL